MAELIHTENGWRYKQEKVHLLRAKWHDYFSPAIYMLTLTSVGRESIFGRLDGDVNNASIKLTTLGEIVAKEIERIPEYKGFECAEIFKYVVMPDHVHILLYVHERLNHPLGYYVSWFKKQCSDKAQELANPQGLTSASATCSPMTDVGSALAVKSASISQPTLHRSKAHSTPLIFDAEYHDRILLHNGQLDNMRRYIADNPRRLWLKRANPDLFRIHQNVSSAELEFTALGNMFLLDYPNKAVIQCSRSLTQQQIDEQKKSALIQADCGVGFVSAGISEGEKKICRALREAGYPLIILLKDGFPASDDPNSKYFKPQGVYFEACAKGKLLLLEPKLEAFEHSEIVSAVNKKHCGLPHDTLRYRFLALNEIAHLINNATTSLPNRSCSWR